LLGAHLKAGKEFHYSTLITIVLSMTLTNA
jgi:hypothetical protein